MSRSKSIKKSNCNGILIETEHFTDKSGEWWEVSFVDQFDEWAEPEVFEEGSEAEALARHDAFVEEFKDKPNWNAQAAYDEAHGTINGEDPGIVMMRELGW